MAKENYSAADMVIDTLKNNNVDYVFGIQIGRAHV